MGKFHCIVVAFILAVTMTAFAIASEEQDDQKHVAKESHVTETVHSEETDLVDDEANASVSVFQSHAPGVLGDGASSESPLRRAAKKDSKGKKHKNKNNRKKKKKKRNSKKNKKKKNGKKNKADKGKNKKNKDDNANSDTDTEARYSELSFSFSSYGDLLQDMEGQPCQDPLPVAFAIQDEVRRECGLDVLDWFLVSSADTANGTIVVVRMLQSEWVDGEMVAGLGVREHRTVHASGGEAWRVVLGEPEGMRICDSLYDVMNSPDNTYQSLDVHESVVSQALDIVVSSLEAACDVTSVHHQEIEVLVAGERKDDWSGDRDVYLSVVWSPPPTGSEVIRFNAKVDVSTNAAGALADFAGLNPCPSVVLSGEDDTQ